MTQIFNKYIFGNAEDPRIIKSAEVLHIRIFEEYIINKVKPYYGKAQHQLKTYFSIDGNAKNLNEILLARMLNVKGRISNTEEFKKAGIIPKTIRVQRNGKVRESMAFPSFNFVELSHEPTWEGSKFYNYLAPAKFMFIIFQERDDGEYFFDRVMFWNIPNDDLEEIGRVWERAVQTIRQGVSLVETPHGIIRNNLPKQMGSFVAHVRPHGKNAADKLPLPDGRLMTRQCFWLNNSYIEKQISMEAKK